MITQEDLKKLNPKDEKLIFGCKYSLYLKGKYLGVAIWTKDENIGNSFQTISSENKVNVYLPDRWVMLD